MDVAALWRCSVARLVDFYMHKYQRKVLRKMVDKYQRKVLRKMVVPRPRVPDLLVWWKRTVDVRRTVGLRRGVVV